MERWNVLRRPGLRRVDWEDGARTDVSFRSPSSGRTRTEILLVLFSIVDAAHD